MTLIHSQDVARCSSYHYDVLVSFFIISDQNIDKVFLGCYLVCYLKLPIPLPGSRRLYSLIASTPIWRPLSVFYSVNNNCRYFETVFLANATVCVAVVMTTVVLYHFWKDWSQFVRYANFVLSVRPSCHFGGLLDRLKQSLCH